MYNGPSAYSNIWTNWFSGTNCWARALVYAGSGGITVATLSINGTTIQSFAHSQYNAPPTIRFDIPFDSTHFPDGSSIEIEVYVENSLGLNNFVTRSAPAYNKAFVFGNVTPGLGGMGNLVKGYQAAQNIEGYFSSADHTPLPSGPTPAVNQTRGMILPNIPWCTAFAFYSHGNDGLVGDSATGTANGQMLTTSDITAEVAAKSADQPPVNFVFADSCMTGVNDKVANAFQVGYSYGPPVADRAFLGWFEDMQDNPSLIDWTGRLFTYLLAGESLKRASDHAGRDDNDPTKDLRPYDDAGGHVSPMIYGDPIYKLHGLYNVEGSTQWY